MIWKYDYTFLTQLKISRVRRRRMDEKTKGVDKNNGLFQNTKSWISQLKQMYALKISATLTEQ